MMINLPSNRHAENIKFNLNRLSLALLADLALVIIIAAYGHSADSLESLETFKEFMKIKLALWYWVAHSVDW